jgi:hypothetical protein
MLRRGTEQLVSVMCAKDRADAEAGLGVPTSVPLVSANSRSRSSGRSCRSSFVTALQKFALATSPLALLGTDAMASERVAQTIGSTWTR